MAEGIAGREKNRLPPGVWGQPDVDSRFWPTGQTRATKHRKWLFAPWVVAVLVAAVVVAGAAVVDLDLWVGGVRLVVEAYVRFAPPCAQKKTKRSAVTANTASGF